MVTANDIIEKISEIVGSSLNSMKLKDQPAFEKPLVGFGAGDDPLFQFYKKDIGDFLLLPNQWLELKYSEEFDGRDITLVCWALPQTEHTKQVMKSEDKYPCYEWSLVRTYGEAFNRELGRKMEDFFESNQIKAIAPLCNDKFKWENSEKYGYASNWSERHAAYISGLGTFGLCQGLISDAGKAVRYGSVIVNINLPKTKKKYSTYNEYCLADDGCTACIERCPAGAITKEGHDKSICSKYQRDFVIPYAKEHFNFEGIYGCGLCQTNVPCQSKNPRRIKL